MRSTDTLCVLLSLNGIRWRALRAKCNATTVVNKFRPACLNNSCNEVPYRNMWCLRNPTSSDVTHRLLCEAEYTVGRKNVDILITNDQSISREHAVLTVSAVPDNRISDDSYVPLLRLKDLGSKYGTAVNSKELSKSEETTLNQGDTVAFGRLGSKYKICYEPPMVVATSCVAAPEKERLKTTLKKIGARLQSEWSEKCTHVVMSAIRLTAKTTAALLAAKPVVTPAFFTELLERLQRQDLTPVDPALYIPEVSEECLSLGKEAFGCNEARKTLFAGKTFYFLTEKQYQSLGALVNSGGARSVLWRDPDRPTPDLLRENSCVIKPGDNTDNAVCRYLRENNLHAVSASDVGLAVIHCSTARHCNPRSSIANVLFGDGGLSTQTQAPSQDEICAPNTELSQQGMPPRRCQVAEASETSLTIAESKLASLPASRIEKDLELTRGANTGTTTVSQEPSASMLATPAVLSPLKNFRSTAGPSSPKRSPSKLRKKDAKGTLPLECYFNMSSRKRKDDVESTSAAKKPRANPPLDVSVEEVRVKEEVITLPSPEPEQQEHNADTSDHDEGMGDDFMGSYASSTNGVPQTEQRQPHQSESAKQPCTKPSAWSPDVSVNGSHDPERLLIETSVVVLELADLVLRTPNITASTREVPPEAEVRNFKRFHKAHQAHLGGLPKIIGGPDLEVYDPNVPRQGCADMEADSQDVSHVFNYDQSTPKRRRIM